MRVCLRATALLLAVGFVAVVGIACNKSISKSGSALQTASPEVKKGWDVAMAAMNTNGYAVAIMELQKIRSIMLHTFSGKRSMQLLIIQQYFRMKT